MMRFVNRTAIALCLWSVTVILATGQENDEGRDERIKSIREERRETLLYGIDSQVLEVVQKIKDERDELLLDDIFAVFKLSKNPEIRRAAVGLFEELDFQAPLEDVIDIVSEYEDEDEELVIRSIAYVSKERSDEIADVLLPLIDSANDSIARAAIRGIGRAGSKAHAEELLERFESSRYDAVRKPDIILAFGELGSEEVVDTLIDILEDEDEEMTWRRYACDALGKIGDPRALPSIERALVNSDAMLRAYAVSSIRYFESDDIVPSLIQGLKDSFWRVRISAAQGLAAIQAEEAVPILAFKARRDPELKVRDEALRALSGIGNTDAFTHIRKYFTDVAFSAALRVTCAEMLAEHDLEASIETFIEVIGLEWDQKNSKVLERTAYFLSLSENARLAPIYAKLLESGDIVLTIYGIRGIERNGFEDMRPAVESLSGEGNHRSIRRAAITALESL